MMACVSAYNPFMTSMSKPTMAAPSARVAASESPSKSSFRVVRELGSGLQGHVVLALDEKLNKHVAVKLPTVFATTSTQTDWRLLDYQVQSIVQERNAHRFVHHDNVIKCLRMVPGKKNGRSYVAMVTEYASNGDLFDAISAHGAMPHQVAKFYFHQLMQGINACHESGVVHRDIKPENILFDENFTLKICDFGLAETSRDGAHADSIYLRDVSGTALYLAPEARAMKTFRGTPLDVWACGIVLFIILTGFPPFQAAKVGDYWYDCVISGRMDKFWRSQPKELSKPSASAMDLINRMLCPNPAQRITVKEILAHPFLSDVGQISRKRVVMEMAQRSRRSN